MEITDILLGNSTNIFALRAHKKQRGVRKILYIHNNNKQHLLEKHEQVLFEENEL